MTTDMEVTYELDGLSCHVDAHSTYQWTDSTRH